jgi:hypothetical protein
MQIEQRQDEYEFHQNLPTYEKNLKIIIETDSKHKKFQGL